MKLSPNYRNHVITGYSHFLHPGLNNNSLTYRKI